MPNTKLPKPVLLVAIVALYSVAHLTWYLDTPLGASPVLDGQENLNLAQQIADGSLAREPFYRAMLYPALLAVLPIGHSLLGLLCHLANTALSSILARRFWQNESAGLLAGALVGLNPVLLHFAFDPLDTTLAITLFLASLFCLQNAFSLGRADKRTSILFAASGLLISLATLARPHFLLPLVALAGLLLFTTFKKSISKTQLASYTFACLAPLVTFGFVQQNWSGTFQILPWQGAYNLWISNNSQANGLYYQQSISFHHLEDHQNPNRLEAAFLFEKAHDKTGSISEQNAYWRSRTFEHVISHPLRWLKLEAFKLYASFNNFEQYNNKTYQFHKRLSPWLKYNPIGWGGLLVIATFCCCTLWRQRRKDLLPILILSTSIFAGLLIYMASSRFRLPLTPVLAILSGGLPLAWSVFRQSSLKKRIRISLVVATAFVITFSRFAGVVSQRTYIQDALLLADSAAQIGDDELAIKWSNFALAKVPNQQQGLRLRLISNYNQIASGTIRGNEEQWKSILKDSDSLSLQDELLCFIRGTTLWNLDKRDAAINVWQSGYANFGQRASACVGALLLTGQPIPKEALPSPLETYLSTGRHWILATTIASKLDDVQRKRFLASIGLPTAAYLSIGQSMSRILPYTE